MNSFYQESQDSENIINFNLGPNFTYPAHFHQKIEIFFLKSGEFGVWRNGVHYTLRSGDIMFFDNYDVHAYDVRTCIVSGIVLIIPNNVAQKFFARKGGKKIVNPLISDPELCNKLYGLSNEFVVKKDLPTTVKCGAIELILSLIEQKLEFTQSENSDETTLACQ